MNGKPVTVVARLRAKPGKEQQLRELLLSLVAASRKDAGCLNYDLHQSKQDPAQFIFHENWASQAHLDQHLAKPDLKAALDKAGQMVAEPPQITLWERIP